MPKAEFITKKHYNGDVTLRFYPKSHRYYVDDAKFKRHNKRLSGATTITGILDKSATLMDWTVSEGMRLVFGMAKEKQEDGQWKLVRKERVAAIKAGERYTAEQLDDIMIRGKTAYKAKQTRGKDFGTQAHEWIEKYLIAVRDGEELPGDFQVDFDPSNDEEAKQAKTLQGSMKEFVNWFESQQIDEIIGVEYFVYSRKYGYCGTFDSLIKINGKVYLIDFKTSNPSWQYPDGVYPEYMAQLAGYDIAFCEEFPEYEDKIDGYMVWNASKKSIKFVAKELHFREEARNWFEACYGAKMGSKFFISKMSLKYRENKK